MTADLVFHIISRFIHISSVVILLGGLFYARQVLVPTFETLPEDTRANAAVTSQNRFRNPMFSLLVLILASGLYNFFTGPKHGRDYQIWFGIKMLLVAHLAATAILWATSPYGDVTVNNKRKKRLLSVTISGLVIIAISAYLRSLTLRGL
ncbi:MAG TPA: hypothetical protein VH351_13330 [Bryobacteraceae bacterium]|nr:hypothetical protein [Bryobacteraceae bacterium]